MDELVPLVAVEDLPADLRAQYEATGRPGLRDFIRLMAHAPDHFRRYTETYGELRFNNHLGPRVTELVRLATAQTTRCPVCMAGRHPSAIEAGLTEELVAEIGSDQPTLMTTAEVVAVGFALKFSTDHLAIDASDKAALRQHFTPEQIVEIGSEQPTLMTSAEVVAVRFARKFSTDHLAIDASDKAALREHFTPEQIVELGLLCVMCLVGRFSLLAGLEEPSCPT